MPTRPILDVWLYGDRIAALISQNRLRSQMRLEFAESAIARFGPGSLVLSCSMSMDPTRRPNGAHVRAFFSGLLPEGEARSTLERRFRVPYGDTFGLLEEIGRDCAGAIVLRPAESEWDDQAGSLEILGPGELEREIAELEDRPLGADEKVRVSLPGVQEKLVLAKTATGEWARPVDGHPSTHILKPEKASFPGYAGGEAFCLAIARELGLTSIDAEVIEADGTPVVAISRYDRRRDADDHVSRIHQEDLTQALGVDTLSGGGKYEADGGPSLRDAATLLGRVAETRDVRNLLRTTVLNVVVGNAGAHAKNLSLLHASDGTVSLAPLYDVTPTTFYRQVPTSRGPKDLDDTPGMFVGGKRSIHEITRSDLISEGRSWGLLVDVDNLITSTLEQLEAAIDLAAKECPVHEIIVEFVRQRRLALAESQTAAYGERSTSTLL
jgi:serine/threonine-protein kinase HipA